ncbi:unnamed protein product [Prorocentrum cordatum]|uniref:Uncharacterized protein n=1 Tax=Prorocentrum cordatum TaxID=2364126 RepID=A0ABN9UUZ7_9DINO|nr:unnamed protein product [Polarella glacialis]
MKPCDPGQALGQCMREPGLARDACTAPLCPEGGARLKGPKASLTLTLEDGPSQDRRRAARSSTPDVCGPARPCPLSGGTEGCVKQKLSEVRVDESWRSSARFEARVCSAWLAPRRPQASSCGVPSCCGGGDHSAAHPELGVSGASSGRTAADDFDPAGERGAPAAPAARAASLACQAASSPRRRTC